MGNAQTQQNIGDFQQGAGQVTASLGLISAYFGAFIMIGFSILFIYLAVTDQSFSNVSSNNKCTADSDCISDEKCQNNKCTARPGPKEKHYWLLIVSAILIGLAIFAVYYAKTVKNIADTSRGGAQFVGLMGEAELAREAFKLKPGKGGCKSTRMSRNKK